MRKIAWLSPLLLMAILLVASSPAAAHSPLFPVENHSIDTAMAIDDPAKSIAIYHELESEEAAYYELQMKAGERIFLQTLIPVSPQQGFIPGLALLLPGVGSNGTLPSFVEVPSGYHTLVAPGDANAEGELEPFTPGPIFILAEIDVVAPVDGTYYGVVFSNDQGGNYAIAIGYLETFTAEEILSLPVDLLTIYQWEGQALWQALLPYVLVFAIGLLLAYYGHRRMGKPDTWVKWLAVISSLAFLGSTASVLFQLAFSFTRVPVSSTMVLSLLFALAYLIMGLVVGRFAFQRKELSLRVRIVFVAIAIIGLSMWGGFYIGPILALVVAFAPPYRGKK
ncbi:MAG: hypothetical protein LUQ16_09035 [Methanomassiliicoccales archaeon]|nr:hypothetical protein [Methanomassiliicoccales archaeon]